MGLSKSLTRAQQEKLDEEKKYRYRASTPTQIHRAFQQSQLFARAQCLSQGGPRPSKIEQRGPQLSRERPAARPFTPTVGRWQKEYRDAKGVLRRRGVRTKQLQFELFLPFPVRCVDPWWSEEQEEHSGLLMDFQSQSGAQIHVPLCPSEPIMVPRSAQPIALTVCQVYSPNGEKATLHACALILNAAAVIQNVHVVPCKVSVAVFVDGAPRLTPDIGGPKHDTFGPDRWPEQGRVVHGNFFATGQDSSPV